MADERNELRTLVAQVTAAYFSNSHVSVSDISRVIEQVSASLAQVGEPAALEAAAPEQPAEAPQDQPTKVTSAQIRKSITPDALISFEDGKAYKTLRRHLSIRGMTPEQYREKWGLPASYPMVSPNYSAQRSALARSLGLGQMRRGRAESAEPAAPKRGRPKKQA